MNTARRHLAFALERTFSIPTETAIVGGVLLSWQAARIPLEGSVRKSIAHAHSWLALNREVGLVGVENDAIALVHHPVAIDVAHWVYGNLHVFAIVTFMLAMRAAAPVLYPTIRTAFVLLHLPALAAVGSFPLAPPMWLAHPPAWSGVHPTQAQLTATLGASLRNATAAVASEHFGYTVLIATGTLRAAKGRLIGWSILRYPLLIMLVVLGTGHHYPLDTVVGSVCVGFGLAWAWLLHRPAAAERPAVVSLPRWPVLAAGIGLVAGWLDGVSAGRVHIGDPSAATFAAPVIAACALVYARPAFVAARRKAAPRLS